MSNSVGSILQQLLSRIITLENAVNRLKTRDGGRNAKSKPVTISIGAISVDRKFHIVAASTGTTDNLIVINAATDGTTVILRAEATHMITLVDGGNLALATNFTLMGDNTIQLIYDKQLAMWLELSRSVN